MALSPERKRWYDNLERAGTLSPELAAQRDWEAKSGRRRTWMDDWLDDADPSNDRAARAALDEALADNRLVMGDSPWDKRMRRFYTDLYEDAGQPPPDPEREGTPGTPAVDPNAVPPWVQKILDQQAAADAERTSYLARQTSAIEQQVAHQRRQAELQAQRVRERARQRAVALDAIETAYKGREPYYRTLGESVMSAGQAMADEWREDTTRETGFDLARRGLYGGSAEVERRSRDQRAYDDKLNQVAAQSRRVMSDARSRDLAERARARREVMSGYAPLGPGYSPQLMFQDVSDEEGLRDKYLKDVFKDVGRGIGGWVPPARQQPGYGYTAGGAMFG